MAAVKLYPYPAEPVLGAIEASDLDIKQTIRLNLVQIQVYLSALRDWYCWVVRCGAKKGHFNNDRSIELQGMLKITCKEFNTQIGEKIGRLSNLTSEDVSYIKNIYLAVKYYNNLHQSFAIQFIPLVVMSECLGHVTILQQIESGNHALKPVSDKVVPKGSLLSDVTVFSRASLRNIKNVSSPVRSKKELDLVSKVVDSSKVGILELLISIIPCSDGKEEAEEYNSDWE
jgi:hypothetical protein